MKYLLVEDEDASLEETIAVIRAIDNRAEISTATNRDQALKLLDSAEFDLILCDLKIPPVADDLDSREDHGLAVHARAREVCPGTPLVFLTGRATPTNVQKQLSHGPVSEYYGMQAAPLVQLAVKDSHRAEVGYIRDMVQGLQRLEECKTEGIDVNDEKLDLLRRAVLVYGRRLAASRARVDLFAGYSGADVASATFELADSQTRSVLIKLQGREKALDEETRYAHNVPNKLRVGYYAPSISPNAEFGLRKKVALYYGLASGCKSLFEIAHDNPELAAEIVARMEADHQPWTSEQLMTEVRVGSLRRARIADDDPRSQGLLTSGWRTPVEDRSIELVVCTSHGDLHGANVLIDPMGRAVLIDYSDVGLSSAALDPITLELSFLFHGDGPMLQNHIPLDQLALWRDVEAYSMNSRYSPVIKACRAWALRIATRETVFATAYEHATRQLKYSDVLNDRALAVARSAGEALLDGT